MEFLVELSDFIEADPVGDKIKCLVKELAAILDVPYYEEKGVLDAHRRRVSSAAGVLVLSRKLPPANYHPNCFVLSDFVKMVNVMARTDLIAISSITLPYELIVSAAHPAFKRVVNSYVKPLFAIKREFSDSHEPAVDFTKFVDDDYRTPLSYFDDQCLKTCLLVLDIQDRVLSAGISNKHLVENACSVIKAARVRGIPMVATEQVPDKLGSTDAKVVEAIGGATELTGKSSFSAYPFVKSFDHVMIVGMETQICVLLTMAQLLRNGKKVTIVVDAIGSASACDDWTLYARARTAEAANSPVSFVTTKRFVST